LQESMPGGANVCESGSCQTKRIADWNAQVREIPSPEKADQTVKKGVANCHLNVRGQELCRNIKVA
jgi:hypothetical protein